MHNSAVMENSIAGAIARPRFAALPWFLAHCSLNAPFALWTFGGSVFLLYLDEVGLPKGQIGLVLCLFPFSGMLALGFAPVATRWGWKRVFLSGYGARKVVMALLLLLPAVVATGGQRAGTIFLLAVISVFAVLRALAETAWYPWAQEFIPNELRGRVAGLNSLTMTLASGAALAIAAVVVGHGTGLGRFQGLIAVGCGLGLLGVACMLKVPGGAPRPAATDASAHLAAMRLAWRDTNYRNYLAGLGCYTVGSLLFTSFLPLFLKERLGLAPGAVVGMEIVVMAGGALAGLLFGWAADRVGSRPVLMSSAALSMAVPLGWLLLPVPVAGPLAWCAALYFGQGVASSGVAIAAGRLLYNNVIPTQESTAYTALYYAWLGLTAGVAPLLAGAVLTASAADRLHLAGRALDGYFLLFGGAVLLLALGWWRFGRVRPDDRHTTRSVMRQLLELAFLRRLLQVWR